jgi:hypothetical protein
MVLGSAAQTVMSNALLSASGVSCYQPPTSLMLTWIGEVVKRLAHDLKRTGDIDQVHLVMKGDKNLNGLRALAGILDCTHCDGIVGVWM